MNMREQFIHTTNELINTDEKVSVLLGGISVASFQENMEKYPNRVFNAGISEQGILGAAAGMSIAGMIPIVHTIAPFLVERAYEQLKLDFGYQRQRGNFVTTGASLDYSSFGATHQCPADIGILSYIPYMQIIVPGTALEFDYLFRHCYDNEFPTYYRLSRDANSFTNNVEFGKGNLIKKGSKATVLAVGPILDMVVNACDNLDVTILYYTTVSPFDLELLRNNICNRKLLICTPFYKGSLDYYIHEAMQGEPIKLHEISLPRIFAPHYGYTREYYNEIGLSEKNINAKARKMIGE